MSVRHGYIDLSGALVLPSPHGNLFRFNEGLARLPVSGGGWAFIDRKGKEVIAPRFKQGVMGFWQGVVPVGEDALFGYIHPDGSWAIPPRFTSAQPFAQGLAAVSFAD